MGLQYACFISYRHHEQSEYANQFVANFYNALSSEISMLCDRKPFIDRERLEGGHKYNEQLASALCLSACMVVIYTPTYFDCNHSYCAREYRAMEQIEQKRFQKIDQKYRMKGLIIPVVLRGYDKMPDVIRSNRLCYDFSGYALWSSSLLRHRTYFPQIKQLADYIVDRWHLLDKQLENADLMCSDFKLPTEADIKPWVERITGVRPRQSTRSMVISPFPGRSGVTI